MDKARSRLSFIFRPQGDEKDLTFLKRLTFANMGANGVTAITPEAHPELAAMVSETSQRAGLPPQKAYVWSTVKPVANAMAIAGNPPIIAFSEGILGLLNRDELAAVTAHELGHVKSQSNLVMQKIFGGIGGGVAAWVITSPLKKPENKLFRKADLGGPNSFRNEALAVAINCVREVAVLVGIAAGSAWFSRKEEYAADRHCATLTQGNGVALVSALQKVEAYNKQGTEPGFFDKIAKPVNNLTRSHPTLDKRREALGVSVEDVAAYREMTSAEPPMARVSQGQIAMSANDGYWQQRVGSASSGANLTRTR